MSRASRSWATSGRRHHRFGRCAPRSCTTSQASRCPLAANLSVGTPLVCWQASRPEATFIFVVYFCKQPLHRSCSAAPAARDFAASVAAEEVRQEELKQQLPTAVGPAACQAPAGPQLLPSQVSSIPQMPPGERGACCAVSTRCTFPEHGTCPQSMTTRA